MMSKGYGDIADAMNGVYFINLFPPRATDVDARGLCVTIRKDLACRSTNYLTGYASMTTVEALSSEQYVEDGEATWTADLQKVSNFES